MTAPQTVTPAVTTKDEKKSPTDTKTDLSGGQPSSSGNKSENTNLPAPVATDERV